MEESYSKKDRLNRIRKIRFPKFKVTPKKIILIILLILIIAISFILGCKYGESKEKNRVSKTNAATKKTNSPVSNKWTAVGIITEISDNQIKVVDSRKKEYIAEINKNTAILDRKGTKLTQKDLKKDLKVIISGEKDKDKLKATRIRIQI